MLIKRRTSEGLPGGIQKVPGQAGQSLILLALAFLGLVAMLGLALDLGLLYIERIHMKRAVDAATLAGVVELPDEEQAMARAIEYLRMNNYDVGNDVNVMVWGCTRSDPDADLSTLDNPGTLVEYVPATVNPPRATFVMDTYGFQMLPRQGEDCGDYDGEYMTGTANKIAITGTVRVAMNFMQFFGFDTVPAQDAAVAQNITNLDIALVFDHSGSMQADTICYDCWHETTDDVTTHPYPSNGTYYPISYTLVMTKNLCSSTPEDYVDSSSRHYAIMESEFYSRNESSYYRETRQTGTGYWAVQRGTIGSLRSSSVDGTRSAHVGHNPYWTYGQASPPAPLLGRFYTLEDAKSGVSPRLEYDFTVGWTGDAYIWMRAQGGGTWSFWVNTVSGSYYQDPSKVYWAVDSTAPTENSTSTSCTATNYDYAGSSTCDDYWNWKRIGSMSVISGSTHTLKFWAGSPGYEIDKIVVTSNSGTDYSQIEPLTTNSGRGRPATVGSARSGACDPCNPIYGLTVNPSDCTTPYYLVTTQTNRLADDLFSDFEPLRTSQEAVKRFVKKLDPQFDQVGFVGFSSNPSPRAELACIRAEGAACYNPLVQSPPISYTTILETIETQSADGSTDIADALRNGLEVLGANVDDQSDRDNLCDGTTYSSCGRGGSAKRVLILLTDGSPNEHPTDKDDDNDGVANCCEDGSLWPYNSDPDFDCVMYYAIRARQVGAVVYTIGLGNGVVPELLQAVADETQGTYYYAPSPSDLDDIFDQILANIYVRLIE
jgi:hypothetical protein